jgi:cytochrome c oxidase cbb3-type subunit 3
MEGRKMPKSTFLSVAFAAVALMGSGAVQADAEQLFSFYCAQCHGLEGKGDGPNVSKDFPVDPRNFTNSAEMEKLSDADIKNVVLDGGPSASKSPMMPPWGKTLSEEQVDELVQHLRKLCNCTAKGG